TRSPLPVYAGDDVVLVRSAIDPAGRWLLLVTTPKGYDQGRIGKMPMYVTESGYEEVEDTRTRVGRNGPAPPGLGLVDLARRSCPKLNYKVPPGTQDDLLASVRAENERAQRATAPDTGRAGARAAKADTAGKAKPKERTVEVLELAFNPQGTQAFVQLRANDDKDRWIATVDFDKKVLRPEHR